MSAMSTPINQLPQQVNPSMIAKLDEDPEVLDVIKGMESEFQSQPAPPPSSQPPQKWDAPVRMPSHIVTPIQHVPSESKQWYGIDKALAQRALIVSALAFVIFYEHDLSHLYAKISFLEKFVAYDKFIRAALLAVVIYLLFWKFNM